MRHGCTGTMSKRKFHHHSGCQKRRRDQKKHAKCVHTSRWCWRYFLILRVLFTMSFYHKAGQSTRSIIWKLCNVFVRQLGKKDLMRGRRIDGCSNMTTRPHIHHFLSATSWPNTRRLSFHSLRTLQISKPADFFLFPKWKSKLKGHCFESTEAIKTNSLAHLHSIPKTAFQECFRTFKKRWKRCIQSRGEYFEGNKAE